MHNLHDAVYKVFRLLQCKFEARIVQSYGLYKSMHYFADKLRELGSTVLTNANDWVGNNSVEVFNKTTGPQLQQAAQDQMPIILGKLSEWVNGIVCSWPSIAALVFVVFVLLIVLISTISNLVLQWKNVSSQRQMSDNIARLELRLSPTGASQVREHHIISPLA